MRRIVLLAVLVCAAVQMWGYDFKLDGIYYNILSEDDLTCAVTYAYNSTSSNKSAYKGEVVIPETATYLDKTYSVIKIGSKAFQYCSSLTEVTIPNSITSIGSSAFVCCSSLTRITIPNSVTSIESSAFNGCSSLTEIVLPNNLTSIENHVFEACSSLMEITIPNTVTSIGDYAFRNCYSLAEIEIPNSVTSIGKYAFEECTSLKNVTIGNSVTSIGSYAFAYCESIEEITIGNSVTNIGDHAFWLCKSVSSITSLNVVPPTCKSNSFIYVPIDTCTLYVPLGAKEDYSEATGWKDFYYIEEIDPSGIEELTPDGAEVVGYYTLDGKVLAVPQRGVNVVRYSDGSVKKVVVE